MRNSTVRREVQNKIESMMDGSELSREELMEMYRLARDEYHFQVTLNWQRTQYLLAFNVAILGAAIGLLGGPGAKVPGFMGILLLIGALAAIGSLLADLSQHDFYRQARAAVARVEETLQLPPGLRLRITPGMGAPRTRVVSVTLATRILFPILAVTDVGIAAWAFTQAA